MNLYPAMKGKMGRWDYFIVKMTMRELADNVRFASEVHDDRTLDEAIQRVINDPRVKKEIVTYLIKQPDRFFSSIVVAALDGNPVYHDISIKDDPRFQLVKDDARLSGAFGVLSFDGTQNYYALDGQHRLASIKALIDTESDVHFDAPPGFAKEEISVIVVTPEPDESDPDFLVRYRRLFGHLNRYAKKTDAVDNIIMDEDDVFAIITRRLVREHEFFKTVERARESPRIKTTQGKNLKQTDSFFTSLETLYAINITLLATKLRDSDGWPGTTDTRVQDFARFRPADEIINGLYDELLIYWNALLEVLPVLREHPTDMRSHAVGSDLHDNALFWPITQELMARVGRRLLDFRQGEPDRPTAESAKQALSTLGAVNWDFHSPPWSHLLLIPDNEAMTHWKIRSEDRKRAITLAERVIMWQIHLQELDEQGIEDLRRDWANLLLPAQQPDRVDELWSQIEEKAMAE